MVLHSSYSLQVQTKRGSRYLDWTEMHPEMSKEQTSGESGRVYPDVIYK